MLVWSAELGSFSACARKMGKVQSAVSHGISNLEIDLGVELFDRSSRSPVMTPDGEKLLRRARVLLAQAEELELVAASMHAKQETMLSIACDDGIATPALSDLLADLAKQFPFVQLDVRMMPSTDICQAVAKGGCELGIMFSEIEAIKQVDFCYVGSVDTIAVCHPAHALAGQHIQSLSELSPYRQLSVRGERHTESHLLLSYSPSVWWCSSYMYIKQLVLRDVGWAYLPRFMVDEELESGLLKKMDVSFDHKPWSVPVDLVFKQGKEQGPVFEWMFDALKNLYAT